MIARLKHLVETNYGTHRGLVRLLLAQTEYCGGSVHPFVQALPADMARAVFVCLGNINRSCFAEQIAHREGLAAASFGLSTTTGHGAYEKALVHAPRFTVDLTHHRATDLRDFEPRDGDILFCMEIRHARRLQANGVPAERIRLLGAWARPIRLHIHDPHVLSDAYFDTCFSVVQSAVVNVAREARSANRPEGEELACRST